MTTFKTKTIREGRVRLCVPVTTESIYEDRVFYNPEMTFSRDLSVAVLQAFQKIKKERLIVCDALASTGARGIRYAREVSGLKKVFVNDVDEEAVKLIKKNAKLNKVTKKLSITKMDANEFLSKHRKEFDVVDIDPFGTPVYYMDSAARAVKDGGLVAVTATDTAPLCGTYPTVCLRKYGTKSLRTEYYAELGVRILLGTIAREFAKFALSVEPLLTHSTKHYFRTFIMVKKGKHHADDSLESIGFVYHCEKCSFRTNEIMLDCPNCKSTLKMVGPIWTGKIQNSAFCKKVLTEIKKVKSENEKQLVNLVQHLVGEADMPIFYYDIHELCHKLGIMVPSFEKIFFKLKERKFKVTRTHFCDTAIKTNAPLKELIEILKERLVLNL